MARSKKIKYTGNGDYLPGIPARDMTMKEWRAYPKEKRDTAVNLGLYEAPKKDGDE